MKKILYSLIAAVSFAGCSGLLDTEPLDKYTENVVWNDPTLAQTFIYNTYVDVFSDFLCTPGIRNTAQMGAGMDAYTDNMLAMGYLLTQYQMDVASPGDDFGWNGMRNVIKSSTSGVTSCIRQANVIIENAGTSSLSSKENMVAQGKFLRAMVYFKQARIFGGFMIIDHVLDPSEELNIPRASIDDTYDFIIKDLQDAALGLPASGVNTHITKGAAYALLAEVALQAAAYSEDGGKDEYLKISLKASEDLMALNGYTLDPDYYHLFHDFGKVESHNEVILAFSPVEADGFCSSSNCVQYDFNISVKHSGLRSDVAEKYPIKSDINGIGGHYCITQDLVDEYLVVDEDGEAKKWNETSYYKNYKDGDPAADVLFKNRDARFYASVIYDGTMFYDNVMYFRKGGNAHPDSGKSEGSRLLNSPTPYMVRKAVNDTNPLTTGWGKNMDYDYVLLRLGRSCLNYAEALLRTGETAKAIEWMNKTRVTHGQLPEISATLSAAEAWEAYEAERRIELFFEGEDRYWSLLRWHKYDGETVIAELNKDLTTCIEIGEDGLGFTENVAIREDYFPAIVNNKMVWNERRFLFPVPQSAIDKSNGVIKQNPGW